MRTKPYVCDECDCGEKAEFSSYIKARAAGWAVAKDYSNCYCPKHAPAHRRGGANKKQNTQAALPTGCQQLSLGDLSGEFDKKSHKTA